MNSRTFYVQYYLSQNPDLIAAFGATNWAAATNHWNQFGVHEGRKPNPYFAAGEYLELYADLKNAFGTNRLAATQHWLNTGIGEGRQGAN